MTTVIISEPETQLTELVQRSMKGETIHLVRNGKPVAVLMSEQAYETRFTNASNPWRAIEAWRANAQFDDDDLTDAEIKSWRNHDTERDFSWDE
jgi:prevent-host-death family protein